MTSIAIANELGWTYSHDCTTCSGKYGVFLNQDFVGVELKIKKSKGWVKIYKQGRRIATASALNLEQTLKNNELIKQVPVHA